jgi:Double-GTPase 2
MPFLYGLLAIAAALLYLAYLACALPVALVVALVIYAVGMPAAYLAGLERVLVRRDPQLPGPARQPKIPADADPAVLQYFYGPALADADHAMRVGRRNCQSVWRWGSRMIAVAFGGDSVVLTWPLGAGGAVGMAAGTALGAVAAAGCACVHLLAVGISAGLVRTAGTVLRAADSAVLRVKNIRIICPNSNCYERVPYPGYECPNEECSRRHRDVRPGRFGILRHRCQCGTPMKTLLLFGSSGMNAYCPYCGHSLEHRPGKAPEIVLPFFGAAGAGKTRLLFAMVVQLRMWSRKGFAVEFGDAATSAKLDDAGKLLGPESATAKTPPQLPQAYVIRLVTKRGARILHMFDAAGEFFYTAERTQELRFLDKADTFILVIDPLSVEAFWDQLPPDKQAELSSVRSADPSPELAYQQAHQEMEAMGVPLRKTRLAVVFSRADLINAPADDVAAWACDDLGLGNLVRSVRLNFREARFFHTGAVMNGGVMHESIPALMRWVLGRNAVGVPEQLPSGAEPS